MLKLRQIMGLTCGVCGRLRNDDNDNIACVALFGTSGDPYAVCPSCKAELSEGEKSDQEYRRRVRVYWFETAGRVLRIP